jgi:hypothetical protein
MRACLLRGGLSRASGSANFVLGNEKAWLGTAYHEVLESEVGIDAASAVTLGTAIDREISALPQQVRLQRCEA